MPWTPAQIRMFHAKCKEGDKSACRALEKWKREGRPMKKSR
jgi:hypothetical protein